MSSTTDAAGHRLAPQGSEIGGLTVDGQHYGCDDWKRRSVRAELANVIDSADAALVITTDSFSSTLHLRRPLAEALRELAQQRWPSLASATLRYSARLRAARRCRCAAPAPSGSRTQPIVLEKNQHCPHRLSEET